MICIFQDTHVWVYTINNDGSFNYVDVEGIQSKFTSLPDNSVIDAAMTGIFKNKESLFVITGSTVHIYRKHIGFGVLTPLISTYGIQDSLPDVPSNINSVDAAVRVGATNKYYYFKDGTYYLGVG